MIVPERPRFRSETRVSVSAQKSRPRLCEELPGGLVLRFRRSPTFARLHYHRPGGLNGRVRNGNGCDPAGMVAGKPAWRRSGRQAAFSDGRSQTSLWFHITGMGTSFGEQATNSFGSVRPRRSLTCPLYGESRSGWSSCLAVRTGRLRRSPAVHARPIDLVVFQEPTHYCWKPHLGGGFALRCLQRLSGPDLATRRCRERDSRYTRGRSSPILSY